MVLNWLRRRLRRQPAPAGRLRPPAPAKVARPHLESLEGRFLPSSVGVYDLQDPNQLSINPAILTNPDVDGVALRAWWNNLEPADGVYDWCYLDRPLDQAVAAGKVVTLSASAGIRTPDWVYAEGAAPFHYTDSSGAPQVIPIPWDSVYLARWEDFVRAFGERYASNPAVVQVKLTGLNRDTNEVLLPRTTADTAHWQGVGYTSTRVADAFEEIADTFARAFPNQQLAIIIVPNGLPDIDDQGRVVSGAGEALVETLIHQGIDRYGAPVWVVQNSGLSDFYVSHEVTDVAGQVDTGYEMLWLVTNDAMYRMNNGVPVDWFGELQAAVDNGVAAGARYLDIYRQDIANPALQDVIATAHELLTNSGTGLPAAPADALATVSSSDVRLTWTPRTSRLISEDGFTVERSGNGPYDFRVIATVTSPGFTDTGVPPGNYYYRVRAFNSRGDSPYSNITHAALGPTSPFTDHPAGFAGHSDLQLNNGAAVAGTRLRLTDGGGDEARTAWATAEVPVLGFSTSFILQDQGVQGSADGVTFAIQNNDPGQVGVYGGSLGYGGIGRSVAVVFDLYSGGSHNSTTLVLTDGSTDRTGAIDMGPFGIVLGRNHPLRIDLDYDITQLALSETVTDTVDGNTFRHVYTGLNIPQIVGGTTAYVGFTGGTGGETSTQDVVSWCGRFLDPDQPVSHLDLSAPAQAVAGTPLTVTATARDAFNNVKPDYRGTVHFTSDDPQAALPGDYAFTAADAGVHTFAAGATLYTAGTRDVTATDAVSGVSGSAPVDVVAAAAVAFQVLVPAGATSGTAFDGTVVAVDPYGNTDTNYTGTVTFTSTDGDPGVVLPPDYAFTADDAGVHTFAGGFTLITLGEQTLTATDTVSGITGSATVTVTAWGPAPAGGALPPAPAGASSATVSPR
jgi:hypothetical protein